MIDSLLIGRAMSLRSFKTGARLVGDVDDLMVFSRALSRAEIQKLQKAADDGPNKGSP